MLSLPVECELLLISQSWQFGKLHCKTWRILRGRQVRVNLSEFVGYILRKFITFILYPGLTWCLHLDRKHRREFARHWRRVQQLLAGDEADEYSICIQFYKRIGGTGMYWWWTHGMMFSFFFWFLILVGNGFIITDPNIRFTWIIFVLSQLRYAYRLAFLCPNESRSRILSSMGCCELWRVYSFPGMFRLKILPFRFST